MKKSKTIFILFLFCLFCLNFCKPTNFALTHANNFAIASNSIQDDYKFSFLCAGKIFCFNSSDFKLNLSAVQERNYHNLACIQKLENLNFSAEEILSYVFPETKLIYENLSKTFDKPETADEVFVISNKCMLEFSAGEKGANISKLNFFNGILNEIKSGKKNIKINLELAEYKFKKRAEELFNEKSCFSTNFASSSPERKNNIRLALASLDGVVIEEGEVFSFNNLTGERSEKSGYSQAKIIQNGTFVLGYGGGVCQVSTTLYNACLLAGLEIVESTSHSLPVSYVEPSFDAMVSFGSSDLKVRNNSGGKIILTTSSENDICKVKIYGLKNEYKITRQSEKLSVIPAEPDIIETDYLKFGDYGLQVGDEKRISYPKNGYTSRAYINLYDKSGKLVERKLIRENRYNPTRGVIIKRES